MNHGDVSFGLRSASAQVTHHLAAFVGLSSIGWAGHLIHVAIPASRGFSTGWNHHREVSGLHILSLAALGTASSFAATHIDAFLSQDLVALSALYTHHQYIAGFFLLGAFVHGSIYLLRDARSSSGLVWMLRKNQSLIISHLSAITLFLGFHTTGVYVHNDVMQALGTPESVISISPVFGQWLQVAHGTRLRSPLPTSLYESCLTIGLRDGTMSLVLLCSPTGWLGPQLWIIVQLLWPTVDIWLWFHM